MGTPRNHYQNLKVDRKATTAEIRKAYRSLASIHHPDRNANSERSVKAMQCINAAYEVLMDAGKRATHDAWIARVEYVRPQPKPEPPKPEYKSWGGKDPLREKYQSKSGSKFDPFEEFKSKSSDKRKYESENDHKKEHGTWFGDDMDSIFARWRNPPALKPEHRPKKFDEKHLDDFIKYNDAMRKMLTDINLEYVTPDLIYRAFLIDFRRGKGAPKNLKKAYKSINRAMAVEKTGFISRVAGLYLNRSGFVQGIMAACGLFSVLSLGFLPFMHW